MPRNLYHYSRFWTKSAMCFMRITTKLLFPPLLPLRVSQIPNLLGFPRPWKNLTKGSSYPLPFQHPETHSLLPASQILWKETWKDTHARMHASQQACAPWAPGLCPPDFGLTYLRKYLWPVAVKVISQPGGSGSSSVTS